MINVVLSFPTIDKNNRFYTKGMYSVKKINKMPSTFLCARRAQAFEPDLLAVDNKALMRTLRHRQ